MVSKSTRPRAYFMALSQQLLVLGTVGAALIPAAAVMNLDVVAQTPTVQTPTVQSPSVPTPAVQAEPGGGPAAGGATSSVPVGPVNVTARDVALTAATSAAPAKGDPQASARTVVSAVTPVVGFGIVGLSWAHGDNLAESAVTAEIRTETNGVWTTWTALEYHPEDAPDPNSVEGKHARPGTMEGLVGRVDFVQARLTVSSGSVPRDLKLAVVAPDEPSKTAVEAPAIDTSHLDPGGTTADAITPSTQSSSRSQGAIAPMADSYSLAAAVTPKPQIYSRAQWGANESWRDPTSLHYYEVHGGFVHHTGCDASYASCNNYTAAEVPGIIQGIYHFHVFSRGWSDIGYNFLIDRFGRIWEGRYGGVDRAVVGAHAYGVNDYAFGVAAIGNFNAVHPTAALLNSEGALFAWKLSLSGISAGSSSANVAGHVFNSPIQGHRDAVAVDSRNQTDCPGTYLYAALPTIRRIAAADQAGWSARVLHTNIVGAYPSIVARRASDSQIMVLPTGGMSGFSGPVKVASLPSGWSAVATPDVTGDGKGDLVETGPTGYTVYAGNGVGGFTALATHATSMFATVTNVIAVGDVTGDGKNDLMGINAAGRAVLYAGNGVGSFTPRILPLVVGHPAFFVGAGAMTSDHKPDLLAVSSTGSVTRFHGNGAGSFEAGVTVPGIYNGATSWSGIGDFTGDGQNDVVERTAAGIAYVLPGNGAGGFSHWVGPYSETVPLGNIAGAAVLTGHTYPDLISTHDGAVWMAANTGRTDLRAPIATGIFLPTANLLLNVGDWDGDGHADFMARLANGNLYLYRGKGNGQFYPPILVITGAGIWSNIAAPGDITGDGRPDLQVQMGSSLWIVPGRGAVSPGFAKAYVSHAAIAGTQIAAGLWDGDGAPDSIFRNGNALTVWLGDGPGGLYASRPITLDVSGYNWIAGETSASGGVHPDLFARDASGNLIQRMGIYLNRYRDLGSGLNAYNLLA